MDTLRYATFTSAQAAITFIIKATRLGWTCSSPVDHGMGRWSVCTNCPFNF